MSHFCFNDPTTSDFIAKVVNQSDEIVAKYNVHRAVLGAYLKPQLAANCTFRIRYPEQLREIELFLKFLYTAEVTQERVIGQLTIIALSVTDPYILQLFADGIDWSKLTYKDTIMFYRGSAEPLRDHIIDGTLDFDEGRLFQPLLEELGRACDIFTDTRKYDLFMSLSLKAIERWIQWYDLTESEFSNTMLLLLHRWVKHGRYGAASLEGLRKNFPFTRLSETYFQEVLPKCQWFGSIDMLTLSVIRTHLRYNDMGDEEEFHNEVNDLGRSLGRVQEVTLSVHMDAGIEVVREGTTLRFVKGFLIEIRETDEGYLFAHVSIPLDVDTTIVPSIVFIKTQYGTEQSMLTTACLNGVSRFSIGDALDNGTLTIGIPY